MRTNGLIDLRYGFNTGTTLTANKSVYLVCVPQADGKVKLHTTPISQSLPTTDDGLLYKFLGIAYDTYRVVIVGEKPVYFYANGAVRLWTDDVDFIVGQGTDGNWTYRKWYSGISECWLRVSYTQSGQSWAGGTEFTGQTYTYPSGLFLTAPAIEATTSSDPSTIIRIWKYGSATDTGAVGAFRPDTTYVNSSVTIHYSIHAIGRWK